MWLIVLITTRFFALKVVTHLTHRSLKYSYAYFVTEFMTAQLTDWTMDTGQWTMDTGQWTMDTGQWTMPNNTDKRL